MLLAFLLAPAGLQVWAWRRLRARLASGELTRRGALVRHGGWALAPFPSLVGLLSLPVGLGKLSGAAIVPEPRGRGALPTAALLLGVAGPGWLGFALPCAPSPQSSRERR